MQRLIHKAGKGPDHALDLTRDEAESAFRAIVSGTATPLQVGGFLIALRTKGETGTEIAAYTRVLREGTAPVTPADLDLPCYAGKSKTFRAIPAAILIMRAAGVSVCAHTYDDAPGRQGTGHLLDALDVPHQKVERFHPRLYDLLELRKELGVRSITNVAARLVDPARVGRHLISVSHAPYFDKFRAALEELGERAIIVQGSEGEPEAPYHGVLKVLHVPGGAATYRPEDFGLPRPRLEEIAAGDVDEEAALTRRILDGEPLPHRTIALMTAAAGIMSATGVSFEESLERAAGRRGDPVGPRARAQGGGSLISGRSRAAPPPQS
jgi:anthranilate phosphoribosyltransferase